MPSNENTLLEVDGKSFEYHFLCIDLSPLDPFRWLDAQNIFPKVYWEEKESGTLHAAVGSLLSFSHVPEVSSASSAHARFFGGINEEKDLFWLPEFEMIQEKNRIYLQINFLNHSPSPRAMSRLIFDLPEKPPSDEPWQTRRDTPSLEEWEKEVALALQKIDAGDFHKVVLARKTTFEKKTGWNPWEILSFLHQRLHHVTFFGFAFSHENSFFGATPEHLYTRQGLHLQAEAIAGTAPLGNTEEETFFLRENLLTSEKDAEEFEYVKRGIDHDLDLLTAQKKWEKSGNVISTGSVQHLYARLSATLKQPTSDRVLIETLHPTPAIGGYPKREALAFLKEVEPFSRGWYSYPIGFLSSTTATFVVGIRSAEIQGDSLNVFAGVGIVRQSIAEEEWNELEYKISPIKEGIQCTLPVS